MPKATRYTLSSTQSPASETVAEPIPLPAKQIDTSAEEKANINSNSQRKQRKRIPPVEIYDPWESFNRKIYGFNDKMDRYVAKPLAKGYIFIVPKPVRRGTHNALNNLATPISFMNATLQLDAMGAVTIFSRFVINSTIGILGIFDVAGRLGAKNPGSYTMGQTIAKYGLKRSPYFIIPFMGPSTVTDTVGFGVDMVIDPVFTNALNIGSHDPWIEKESLRWVLAGLNVLDLRANLLENLDDILSSSFDPYTMSRNAYLQHRHRKIYGSSQRNRRNIERRR